MMDFLILFGTIFQVVTVVWILYQLSMLRYHQGDQKSLKYYRRKVFIDLFLSASMLACFYYGSDPFFGPFENYPAYLEYGILSFGALGLFWSIRILEYHHRFLAAWFENLAHGMFFWICLIPVIKLNFFVLLFWFPFYGFLIITPFLFLTSVVCEIKHRQKLRGNLSFLKSIAYGLIPILFFQLVMNFWTEEHWLLWNYVKPENLL